MDAVQEYRNPNLRAIVFRASFVEMTDIIDKTRKLYTRLGGVFTGSPKWKWSFSFRCNDPPRLHEDGRRCVEVSRSAIFVHRLRRVDAAH